MGLDQRRPKGYRKAWNGGLVPTQRYVVAVSMKEAEMLAGEIGHVSRAEAERHLAEVQAPPTDPCYARQYKIFVVTAPPLGDQAREAGK